MDDNIMEIKGRAETITSAADDTDIIGTINTMYTIDLNSYFLIILNILHCLALC